MSEGAVQIIAKGKKKVIEEIDDGKRKISPRNLCQIGKENDKGKAERV